NLSTARAMHRAKEVGVRKSIGALKTQLIGQFLAESFLMNTLAALLAIGIAWLAVPLLNGIIGQQLSLSVLMTTEFWVGFLLIVLLGSLLSGLYPAFVLSSFRPTQVLKSIRITPQRGFSLRRGLITFQFLTSVLLISGTYLVYQQITFMKNQHLGYGIEKVLVVNGPRVVIEKGREVLFSKYGTFRNKVVNHATVSNVSLTSQIPAHGYLGEWNVRKLGEPESKNKMGYVIFADTSFTDTYDIEFLAKKEFPAVINEYERLIINEETVKMLELGSPEEAVGEQLLIFGDTLEVLGVVPNIHWSSLKEAPRPMLLSLDNHYGAYLSIKMNLSNIPETIAHVKSTYQSIYPNDPFHYFFLDDSFNQQYQADLQFGNLFSVFSILAIFIACLGLFALVSYSATLRIKEIGIRKVLGASISNLMLLLSREYLVLLLIAIVLAVPATILGGRAWLENYAYKTEIGLDLLLIPGLILLLISVLTVSYRTYATAKTNPAESLRAE
ncbi:MAG: FtsX-like permease family protein, partial [Bacteroidota bacterium]